MNYCANHIISCSLIYGVNFLGLVAIIVFIIRKYDHYLWAYKKIKEGQLFLEYTIDYTSQRNLPIFVKYISVQLCFCGLFVASLISISLWNLNFGFMEIGYLFIWAVCGFTFYLDYKIVFRFSKEFRIILGGLCVIQVVSMLIFIIDRGVDNDESEKQGFLYTEVSVYFCNFVIMFCINIVSCFFHEFPYEKRYILPQSLIQEESPQSSAKQNNKVKPVPGVTKKRSSFLENLDELDRVEHSMQQVIPPSTANFLRLEEEIIQQQKEDEELRDQILSMHQQLDNKLHQIEEETHMIQQQNLSPKGATNVAADSFQGQLQRQSISPQQFSFEPNRANLSQQSIGPELQKTQPPPRQEGERKFRYEIETIRIDGFQEIKKQRKRQIYFNILYYSSSMQREVKTEHSLKEFQMLRENLSREYVDHSFPELPQKKTQEKLTAKELNQRGQQLEVFLKFLVQHQLKSQSLNEFLKESAKPTSVDEVQPTIDQIVDDKEFEEFFTRSMSVKNTKSLFDQLDLTQFEKLGMNKTVAEAADLEKEGQAPFKERVPEKKKAAKQEFKFVIKETLRKGTTTFYKIESEFNGQVISSVERRYNDFKSLHKKLLETQIVPPQLPDEPNDSSIDTVVWRKKALTQYVNELYSQPRLREYIPLKEFLGV